MLCCCFIDKRGNKNIFEIPKSLNKDLSISFVNEQQEKLNIIYDLDQSKNSKATNLNFL